MNIAQILKNCPKGTVLYSPALGNVTLCRVTDDNYPIGVRLQNGLTEYFSSEGKYFNLPDAEVMLFPSKENQDWTTFQPPHKFEPFQKVLVRDYDTQAWRAGFFSHTDEGSEGHTLYYTTCMWFRQCIPYNEKTKHLLGTSKNA